MLETIQKSKKLYEIAQKYFPGGVNSPVRAFGAVGGEPIYIKKGEGSKIYDLDGNGFIDYIGSWGPLILGHTHPQVIKALEETLKLGISFGAVNPLEIEMAKLICEFFSSIEMLRLVNSGTEAAMSAIRLARGYTGRKKIIKFEGCYHGHSDSLLAKAGSGVLTFGLPDSLGVPKEITKNTLVLPYNNLTSLEKLINNQGEEIAAVIIEPVAANMGVVIPQENFLKILREITLKKGIILIFDEIITGFRLAKGGAQEYYKISPDLTCLGKIIGGGLPVGAYGGKREIMQYIAPLGGVYQAGTLSGNPLALSAGIATLKILKEKTFYLNLNKKAQKLISGIKEILKKLNLNYQLNFIGSIFTLFFANFKVKDFKSAKSADVKLYAKFFQALLKRGIYFPPSQFEAVFVSSAHSDEDLNYTLKSIEEALREICQ